MADLVFYYGAMGCSKTANALMTRFQYLDRGLKVLLVKPAVDTRDDHDDNPIVRSRVGIEAQVDDVIDHDDNLWIKYSTLTPSIIICDESQFLTEQQVDQLKQIAEERNIPIYCYGLRTDFKTKLFEGSKRLFELCSKAIELESICACGKPAVINARFTKDGKIVSKGAQIELGGDERYKPLCYSCWKKLCKDN